MSRMILPGMALKKRGVVINVSSSASTTSMPLLTVYSASKVAYETVDMMEAAILCQNGNCSFYDLSVGYLVHRFLSTTSQKACVRNMVH